MKRKLLSKKNILLALSGLLIGIINGMLGAGGGMIAVPALKKCGLDQKSAHANAVAVILPITVLSAVFYLIKGYVTLPQSYIYMPAGVIGAVAGTLLLRKISPVWLKRIFGAFMVWAGIRLVFR